VADLFRAYKNKLSQALNINPFMKIFEERKNLLFLAFRILILSKTRTSEMQFRVLVLAALTSYVLAAAVRISNIMIQEVAIA
jgi:hypothetical protein